MTDDTSPETPLAKLAPIEALLALEEEPSRYQAMVDKFGFALACYQLACWRMGVREIARPVPTKSDLRSAALTFRNRLKLESVPSGKAIASECRRAGRKVI